MCMQNEHSNLAWGWIKNWVNVFLFKKIITNYENLIYLVFVDKSLHFAALSWFHFTLYLFPVSLYKIQGEESTGRESRPMPVYDVANTG